MGRLIRYTKTKYMKLFEKGISDFWTHKVADYKNDYSGFKYKFCDIARDVFLKTIGYQSLMDSDVSSGYIHLANSMTTPDKKLLYLYIAQNESLHALSYAYGLEQTFGEQAEKILDELECNPHIQERMKVEEKSEQDFINHYDDEFYKMKFIIDTYLLESIKFPLSFFVVFKLNDEYNGAINGFTRALKEIANDELNLHVPTNMNWLKDFMKQSEYHKKSVINHINKRVEEIKQEEAKWSEYLFEKGEPKGLSKELYKYLVDYFSDQAIVRLGIKTPTIEKNIEVMWFDNYRDISKEVVSQQETTAVAYQTDIIDDTAKLDDLKELL